MVTRGYEAKILNIKEIYQGEIREFSEKKCFYINDEDIAKVRVSGVILDTYESKGENQTYYSILLDDGSDTIYIKHWIREEDDYNPQLSNLIQAINIGNIVDLVGKVREYDEELYIVPDSINLDFGIDGEINRRSKVLKIQIDIHGIGQVAKKSIFNDEKSEKDDDISKRILNAMSIDMGKNTVENLGKLLSVSNEEIKQGMRNLQIDGIIYNPRPGLYQKTETD